MLPIRKTYFRRAPRHAISQSSLCRQHVAPPRESTLSSKLPDAWLTSARGLREVQSIAQKLLTDALFFQLDPITPRFMLSSLFHGGAPSREFISAQMSNLRVCRCCTISLLKSPRSDWQVTHTWTRQNETADGSQFKKKKRHVYKPQSRSILDPSRFKMNKTNSFIFLREYKEIRVFYAA